jgi:Protein of unknown function (DUF3089)
VRARKVPPQEFFQEVAPGFAVSPAEGAACGSLVEQVYFGFLSDGGKMHRRSITVLTLAVCFAALSTQAQSSSVPVATGQQETTTVAAPAKNDYSKPETWLCRAVSGDACTADLSTTVIAANGKLTRESWSADPKPPVDCFYVYPTVSTEPSGNSDMNAGPAEKAVVRIQFARFGSVCRLFAPIYRQVTLTALRAAATGNPIRVDRALAYNDVLDAWNYYLNHDNQGRGVILIGHSQGANVLANLIKQEIDGKPVQARIISAMLIGSNVAVPEGKDVGGAFQQMPLCRAATQTGCVITYVSFRANVPPPANSRFGRVAGEHMMAGCTNPAALGGGSGELHAYLTTRGGIVDVGMGESKPWVTPPQTIETPFVSVPGMLTSECVFDKSGSYLAVTVHGDPAGPRASDIPGDVVVNGNVLTDWGLHLIDMPEAMGNLIEIARQESKAYLEKAGGKSKAEKM